MRILERVALPDGLSRVRIETMGGGEPRGWVTSVSKEGAVNLVLPAGNKLIAGMRSALAGGPVIPASALLSAIKEGKAGSVAAALVKARTVGSKGPTSTAADAAAPAIYVAPGDGGGPKPSEGSEDSGGSALPVGADLRVHIVIAPKPMLIRAESELNSTKTGELARDSRVHIHERREMSDGTVRVKVGNAADRSPTSAGPSRGWVTAVTKAGVNNLHTPIWEVVSPKAIVIRAEFETRSERVGMLEPRTRVHVLQSRTGIDGTPTAGTTRAQLALEGQTASYGWVTSHTKDGLKNLQLLEQGAETASPLLPSAATAEGGSMEASKAALGEVAGSVQSTKSTGRAISPPARPSTVPARGGSRSDSPPAKAVGAGSSSSTATRGANSPVQMSVVIPSDNVLIVAPEMGEAEQTESAAAAELVAERKAAAAQAEIAATRVEWEQRASTARETVRKFVSNFGAMNSPLKPVMGETRYERREGHRPSGKDENAPSRHATIAPTMMVIMFNSYRSTFELAYGDVKSLPDLGAYDMRSLVTNASLGRVKIAPEKNAPLVDRVEFNDVWYRGDEHGMEHDGLHGEGTLLLRLDWKLEDAPGEPTQTAIIRVIPWLSYGCGEGARVAVRSPGAIEGRCATVQRALRDDSMVMRFDGLIGEASIDPSPLTVVRTMSVRHEVGTRLLFLHEKACVDATVEKWDGIMDIKEGTRHRLSVTATRTTGWITMVSKDKLVNLREVGDDGGGHSTHVVISYKPLMVRAGYDISSEKQGTIAPKMIVALLETKVSGDERTPRAAPIMSTWSCMLCTL